MRLLYLYLLTTIIFSNEINISSKILDSNNSPIPNVNIMCGDIGTFTNLNGYFSIICDKNTSLDITHITYQNQSV